MWTWRIYKKTITSGITAKEARTEDKERMQQEHVEALKRKTAKVMHIAEAQKKAWFEVWRRVQAKKTNRGSQSHWARL